MRRFALTKLRPVAVRFGSSLAVVTNVPLATQVNKLGVPATREEVAQAHKVPLSILDKAENPCVLAYTQMDLARAKHAKLIATVATDKVDYRNIELDVEVAFGADESKKKPVPGALKKFTETQWNSVKDLIQFYEETMYPIRSMHRVYKNHELTGFHIKDVLKRGLSAFKQDFLDQQKAEQVKVKAHMKECDDFIQAVVKEAFTTAVCNDIANILRVAGEKNEAAHGMCLKVLEDMNMMRVAYDDVTREILRVAAFNDGPYDNSPLLFEVIEAPERGEVSLNKGSLEEISDEALKLISNRHQTPLDDGVLLRSNETHPNLQRSPE